MLFTKKFLARRSPLSLKRMHFLADELMAETLTLAEYKPTHDDFRIIFPLNVRIKSSDELSTNIPNQSAKKYTLSYVAFWKDRPNDVTDEYNARTAPAIQDFIELTRQYARDAVTYLEQRTRQRIKTLADQMDQEYMNLQRAYH